MNTELLLKVKAAILAEPLNFNMRMWFSRDTESPCGTAACLAGHAFAISSNSESLKAAREHWDGEKPSLPELFGCDRKQSTRLCYIAYWPPKFRDRYEDAQSREERAKIAAERIDHFIATEGAE